MSLRGRVFTAVRWTTVGTIFKSLLHLMQIVVLARMLLPEDYGLMAIVVAIIAFGSIFSDFGVNSAFVHRRDVTENQRSSLFWFSVFVSTCLMLLVIVISPLLASFFEDDRLTLLIAVSSSIFFINSLGIQVKLAAEKALFFRGVMVVEVSGALIGFIIALGAAFWGWGVFSLVLSAIATSFFSTLLAWLYLSQGWRPLLRFRISDVRSFLGFGGALVANNIVNQINLTFDLILGGRILTASQLGFYSMPRDLVLRVQGVVNPIITRVAFPLIAELQHDLDRVRKVYLDTLNMTASINAPIYIASAFFADEIVEILLGNNWKQSAEILQILALWCCLRSIGNPVGSLLLGMGRATLSLQWNLGLLIVVPPSIAVGAMFGPTGMAISLLILSIVLFIPGWWILVRPTCKATLFEYSFISLRPMSLALLAIAPAYIISTYVDSALYSLMIGFSIAAPTYLVVAYWLNGEWISALHELVGKLPATIMADSK